MNRRGSTCIGRVKTGLAGWVCRHFGYHGKNTRLAGVVVQGWVAMGCAEIP